MTTEKKTPVKKPAFKVGQTVIVLIKDRAGFDVTARGKITAAVDAKNGTWFTVNLGTAKAPKLKKYRASALRKA